jgi:hypothetical protein
MNPDSLKKTKLVNVDGAWRRISIAENHPLVDQVRQQKIEADSNRETRKKIREQRKSRELRIYGEEKICGNCRYLHYSGIQEIKMEFGNCDEYKKSKRLVNRPEFSACELWKRRSANKIIGEKVNSAAWVDKMSRAKFR